MKIRIYQIDPDRDENRVKFQSLADTKALQGSSRIAAEIYDRVFLGYVDCKDLEEVFALFNTAGHRLHRGHSLSVSDIVEVEEQEGFRSYFCDTFGFAPAAFEAEKVPAPVNVIRVLVVEPHRAPYESEIENTLRGRQHAVGGRIQYIRNGDGTLLVVNEEGKLKGMEGNRRDKGDVLTGPFFVAGDAGETLRTLTEEQMAGYAERFAEPEDIPAEEIEAAAAAGYQVLTWQ